MLFFQRSTTPLCDHLAVVLMSLSVLDTEGSGGHSEDVGGNLPGHSNLQRPRSLLAEVRRILVLNDNQVETQSNCVIRPHFTGFCTGLPHKLYASLMYSHWNQ